MAYTLFAQNGKPAYGVKNYILDTKDDLLSLTISDTPGSTAFVVDEGKTYILTNQQEWTVFSSSNGGSSSSGGGSSSSSDSTNIESISEEMIDAFFEGLEDYESITNEQIDAFFEEEEE